MTSQTATRDLPAKRKPPSPLRRVVITGVSFGVVAVYLAVVGILAMIHGRAIIVGVLTMGHAALLAVGIGAGIAVARRERERPAAALLLDGALAGAITGALLAVLVVAMNALDLRSIFIALSPALLELLTFGVDLGSAVAILIGAGAILGAFGAVLTRSPLTVRQPLLVGCTAVVIFGVFQELIQLMMQYGDVIGAIRDALYTWEGLTS